MCVRQPRVKGKERNFDTKCQRKTKKQVGLFYKTNLIGSAGKEAPVGSKEKPIYKRSCVIAQVQQSHQHNHGANKSIYEEFYCCMDTILSAPDANQKVHGNQRQLKENVEYNQIKSSKEAH